MRHVAASFALGLLLALPAGAQQAHQHAAAPAAARTPSPAGAAVYFISPQDGETLSGPITVRFGLRGMGVAPADVERPNTGHHHLLINMTSAELRMDEGIPAHDQSRHFGGGQTEAVITLPPGTHRLQLVLGDHNHVPHQPPVISPVITITVR
jgi:hypothetical protein